MSKTRGVIVALFVLVVGAMGIAACGGDDDDATTSATATQQSSAAVSTTAAGGATSAATAAATTVAANPTDAPSNGGSDIGDACDLLTKEEVEAELGETVNAPDDGDTFDVAITGGTAAVSTCGWTSESFASSISVTFWSAPGLDQGIEGMIQLACTQKEEISGLGDQACWYDQQHVQIQAAKGGYFLDIFATMSGDASDALQTLAAKAVGRLP